LGVITDTLGVALAHQEHDGRGVRGAGVGQAGLPVLRQGLAELGDFVDVAGQGQGHHVGAQAVDHRTALLARATVGLLDLDLVVRVRLLPVLDEFGVVLLIQLAGGVIGHVQQLVVLGDGGTGKHGTGQCGQGITADGHGEAPDWRIFF
jgi:hypothetical protein